MTENGQFKSTREALVFAFNFSEQQYAITPMAKLMRGVQIGNGTGLYAEAGAAQAGMIKRQVKALGPLQEALIIAKIAERERLCTCGRPCCAGSEPNMDWLNAVGYLTDHATRILPNCVSNYRLRRGIIMKAFGEKVVISDLADKCEVSRRTATDHHGKIMVWLKGARRKGDQGDPIGVEQMAMAAIDERLREVGIVEPLCDEFHIKSA